MKTIPLLSSLIAATVMSPAVMAQFPVLVPAPVMVQPSAKQFSSKAVRASFRGFKEQENSPTLSDMLAPPNPNAPVASRRIAIFQVIEPLAYKRLSPYASDQLKVGDLFKVELDRPLMGQTPEITETVKTLQVGEEVVAKIDELFVFNGHEQGELITPLVRMVRRNAPPAVAPAPAPAEELTAVDPALPQQEAMPMPSVQQAQQPQQGGGPIVRRQASSTFVSVRTVNGVTEKVEVIKESVPNSTEMRTRMYINGVEVDPETKQPLAAPAAIPAPAPAEATSAPAPSPVTPEDDNKEDSATPAPPAAPEPPVQNAEPMPQGTTF